MLLCYYIQTQPCGNLIDISVWLLLSNKLPCLFQSLWQAGGFDCIVEPGHGCDFSWLLTVDDSPDQRSWRHDGFMTSELRWPIVQQWFSCGYDI